MIRKKNMLWIIESIMWVSHFIRSPRMQGKRLKKGQRDKNDKRGTEWRTENKEPVY